MNAEEKEELTKLLTALKNSLSSAVEAIDAYLKALEPKQELEIRRNGGVYGRLAVRPNEVVAAPAAGLNIRVSDLAIQRFLVPKVLEAVKRKHGVDYAIEAEGETLKSIRLKGTVDQKEVEKLVKVFAWVFEKAATRQKPATG